VADPLPAGMTFVSVTTGLRVVSTHDRALLAGQNLAKGQSVNSHGRLGHPLSLAKQTKTNEATVSSTTPDPISRTTKDNATVKITGAPPRSSMSSKFAKSQAVELTGDNSPR